MGIVNTNSEIIFGEYDSSTTLCRVVMDSRDGLAGKIYKFLHGVSDFSGEISSADIGAIKTAADVSQSEFDDVCFAKFGTWYSAKATASKLTFREVIDGTAVAYVKCRLHQEYSPTINIGSATVKGCLPGMFSAADASVAAFQTEMASNYSTWWSNRSVSEKEVYRLLLNDYAAA